jgi:hypothetical protein
MVEKRSKGLGGLTSETKKLAAYDKPHAEGKKGAKVAQYAKGGAVKKAHAKKPMPPFLKAKMMKKAEGGPVAEITPSDGMSPLQEMAYALPYDPMKDIVVERELPLPPEFNEEGMRVGPDRGGSRMYDPTRDAILEQTLPPLPPPELTPLEEVPFRQRESGPRMERWSDGTYHFAPEESGRRTPLSSLPDYYRRMSEEALANKPPQLLRPEEPMPPAYDLEAGMRKGLASGLPPRMSPIEPSGSGGGGGGGSSDVGIGGLFGGMPAPSPLARAAMPTKADRMATRRDNMMAARDIMDRYIGGERNAMPRRSMAPGMRGMAEGKARRAMPVAPREPMIQLPRAPRGGIATFAKGGKVSKGEKKIGKVMGEFKRGELHSGSKKGPVVTNPKQAKAIALSEARAAGAKVPKKRAMGGRACG